MYCAEITACKPRYTEHLHHSHRFLPFSAHLQDNRQAVQGFVIMITIEPSGLPGFAGLYFYQYHICPPCDQARFDNLPCLLDSGSTFVLACRPPYIDNLLQYDFIRQAELIC